MARTLLSTPADCGTAVCANIYDLEVELLPFRATMGSARLGPHNLDDLEGHCFFSKSIFWSAARQAAAGRERRRPGAAPVGKESVGLNRWLRRLLWGLLGRGRLPGVSSGGLLRRSGRRQTDGPSQQARLPGRGKARRWGRRGRRQCRGYKWPVRPRVAGAREQCEAAVGHHEVSSGSGGSAPGSNVSTQTMWPRRQAGHRSSDSPVSCRKRSR